VSETCNLVYMSLWIGKDSIPLSAEGPGSVNTAPLTFLTSEQSLGPPLQVPRNTHVQASTSSQTSKMTAPSQWPYDYNSWYTSEGLMHLQGTGTDRAEEIQLGPTHLSTSHSESLMQNKCATTICDNHLIESSTSHDHCHSTKPE
jgi:hypothetical protein